MTEPDTPPLAKRKRLPPYTGDFVWVRSIGRYWVFRVEQVSILAPPVAFVLFVLAALFGYPRMPQLGVLSERLRYVAGTLVIMSVIGAMLFHWLFYGVIRCPKCGYNPARGQSGKKLLLKSTWTKIARLTACPKCDASTELATA